MRVLCALYDDVELSVNGESCDNNAETVLGGCTIAINKTHKPNLGACSCMVKPWRSEWMTCACLFVWSDDNTKSRCYSADNVPRVLIRTKAVTMKSRRKTFHEDVHDVLLQIHG